MDLRVRSNDGNLISRDRSKVGWLAARRKGITATDANKLIKLDGERRASWDSVFASKVDDNYTDPSFESFDLGIDREPQIAAWTVRNFPNEEFVSSPWLFSNSEEERFLATPDMVGKYAVAEIKVSTVPLRLAYSKYRDQVQWQLHVLGSDAALFIVENRHTQEKEWAWIEQDGRRIAQLEEAALEMLADIDDRRELF